MRHPVRVLCRSAFRAIVTPGESSVDGMSALGCGHSHCSKIFLCSHGLQTQDLSEILEWRFHSALFLACDGRLLQIELALDAPARLVGNFALAQQPVDEFTLGSNQVGSEFRDSRSSFEPI